MTSVYFHGAPSSPPQEEMLRTAQAQSEEEQLRNALEASCHTESAAAAEEELVRQAIAESIASTGRRLEVDAGAVDGVPAATASGKEVFNTAVTDEEEDLRRALLLSGMSEEWGAPPDSVAGVDPGFNLAELQEETELRRAIDASLSGE